MLYGVALPTPRVNRYQYCSGDYQVPKLTPKREDILYRDMVIPTTSKASTKPSLLPSITLLHPFPFTPQPTHLQKSMQLTMHNFRLIAPPPLRIGVEQQTFWALLLLRLAEHALVESPAVRSDHDPVLVGAVEIGEGGVVGGVVVVGGGAWGGGEGDWEG